MADRVNISELSSALDTYLDKIERVRLSKSVLEEHAAAIDDLVSAVDLLSEKESALSAAGSSRAGLVSDIRSGLLSGSDVSTLLSRESRAAAMRPDGVPGLSLSDVQRIKSASGAVPLLQSGGASIGMLKSLSAWSSTAGGPPPPSGVYSAMESLESRMLGLGVGLTRGGSASLVADIEGDSVRDEMLSSAEDIHEGTEALLEALGSRKTPLPAVTPKTPDTKLQVPQVEKASWWSTLKTVGLVVGAATGVFGLLGNDSVQRFIQENLLSAEGRQALWGKLTSVFETISSKVSDFVSLGTRLQSLMQRLLSMQEASASSAVAKAAAAGLEVYNSLSEEDQSNVRAFQSAYEEHLEHTPAPLPAGITSADMSALRMYPSMAALQTAGYFSAVQSVGAGGKAFSSLRKLYRTAMGAAGGVTGSSLLAGFSSAAAVGAFAFWLGSSVATSKAADRESFNQASLLAAYLEGSPLALFYPKYGGGADPEPIPLGSLLTQLSDGTETALYNTLDKDQKLGYSTALMGALPSLREERNALTLVNAIRKTPAITLDSGEYIEDTSFLKDMTGPEAVEFVRANPKLARSYLGTRNVPLGFGSSDVAELDRSGQYPVYMVAQGDPFFKDMSDTEREHFIQGVAQGMIKVADPKDLVPFSQLSGSFDDKWDTIGGWRRDLNKTIMGVATNLGMTSFTTHGLRRDVDFNNTPHADRLRSYGSPEAARRVLNGVPDTQSLMPGTEPPVVGQSAEALGVGTVLAPPEASEQGSKAQGVTINSASPTSLTYVYRVGGNSQEGAER